MSYKTIFFALLFLVQSAFTQIQVNAQTTRLFAVSDLEQVFEDGYKLP